MRFYDLASELGMVLDDKNTTVRPFKPVRDSAIAG
jgi:hypothetical protein